MLHHELGGKGETILFLHGALVSSTMWKFQVDYFKKRYQVMLIDLPEHGKSRDIKLPEYTIQHISRTVLELIETLDITHYHLCGHSLGGMVAQDMVFTQPDSIQKLILAETSYGTGNTLWERIQTAFAKPMFTMMNQKQLVNMSKKAYGALSDETKTYIENEMSMYDITQSRRVMSAVFKYTSKNNLHKIQNKTLILVGAHNRQTHNQAEIMNELIKNSQYVKIENAHHLLNMDNPSDFNNEVEKFLLMDTI
jgi:3-oxoadipate enol-lactonase